MIVNIIIIHFSYAVLQYAFVVWMRCNFNVTGALWYPFMIKFGSALDNDIHSSVIEHQTNLIPLY